MESHQLLSSPENNSAMKVWRNSVSKNKKQQLLSNNNNNNGKNPLGASSLVSSCAIECEEKEVGKKAAVVLLEEEEGNNNNNTVLRSAWIQRIIPRVPGDEKDAGSLAGRRREKNQQQQSHESLVGFWKKKAFCIVADVGSDSAEIRVREESPSSHAERSVPQEEEDVKGCSSGGAVSSFLGSRVLQRTAAPLAAAGLHFELPPAATKLSEFRQQLGLGFHIWEHNDNADAAGCSSNNNNSSKLLLPPLAAVVSHLELPAATKLSDFRQKLGLGFQSWEHNDNANAAGCSSNNNNNNSSRLLLPTLAAVGSHLELPAATKLSEFRQQLGLGFQSWEHNDNADAAGCSKNSNNSNRLLSPPVIPSGNVSNAVGGVVVAAGLGLQFDGGGGGGSMNWLSNSNSSKERDMINSSGPSSLPLLSLFAPFKHKKEWRRKKMNCQGSNSSNSGKTEVVTSMPLLTPLLPPPGYGGKEIRARTDQMAGTTQRMMDRLPSSLTSHCVPCNPSIESIAISTWRAADTGLRFGDRLKRPLGLTQVFSPFKSSPDANVQSPCSSQTASLPFELVSPLDTDGHDSVQQEDTGAMCKLQPANGVSEQHQKLSGLSANVRSARVVSSSIWPEHGNRSGNQESSGKAAEAFRHKSSTAHLLGDHQPKRSKTTKEVALEDPNVRRLFSEAGSCGSTPPVPLVVGVPGYQSPFQSKSSFTHVKAVSERNRAVLLQGYHNPATETSQQKLTEKTQGWNCSAEELHGQERQPVNRELAKEQTREQERGSGPEEAKDVVARKDVDTTQVRLGSGALESGRGSGSGFVHMLGGQEGSRQGGDVAQRHGSCNLLTNAPDNNGPACRTSFRKRTRDASIDVPSPSHVLEDLHTTPSHVGTIPGTEDEYPKVPNGQSWLHRWMRPSISMSNNSSSKPLSASRVSSGSGVGTAELAASNAHASTGTESQEGATNSRRVQNAAGSGLESEGERRHPAIGIRNQFAKTERGNVSVGEDHGSRSKRPFFLGNCSPPSAAAIALVGAASRRPMTPLPPQRPGTRVAVWPSTPDSMNSSPHALPHGSYYPH